MSHRNWHAIAGWVGITLALLLIPGACKREEAKTPEPEKRIKVDPAELERLRRRPDADPAQIRAAMSALDSPDLKTRLAAIEELGRIGPQASDALPKLEQLAANRAGNSPGEVWMAAQRAIASIKADTSTRPTTR